MIPNVLPVSSDLAKDLHIKISNSLQFQNHENEREKKSINGLKLY